MKTKTTKNWKKNWQIFFFSKRTNIKKSFLCFFLEFQKMSRKSIDFVHPIHVKNWIFFEKFLMEMNNVQCPSTNVIISMCVLSFFFVINIQIDKFYLPCFRFFDLGKSYFCTRFGLTQRISCLHFVSFFFKSKCNAKKLLCCLIHTKNKIFCLIPHKYRNAV